MEQELRDFYEQETWTIPAKHHQLQQEAKAAGLWNLFLPLETDPEAKFGAGLTNLEYAHLCEVLHVFPLVIRCRSISSTFPVLIRWSLTLSDLARQNLTKSSK